MIAGRGWAACLLLLLLGAGCGSTTHALGTTIDAAADEVDAATVDTARPDLPRIERLPPPAVCGNGQLDPGEQCDDGNTTSGDGCSQFCQIECPFSDPTCASNPQPLARVCGDGFVATGEACDDGNVAPGDGCAADCGAVEAGWTCPVPGTRCFPICGDSVVTPPETCDDGNQESGDGCSSTCLIESPCFGADGSPAACPATCGNGRIDGSEACDDGASNADVAGACSPTCHRLYCGDGVVTPPETCDSGPYNAPTFYVPTISPGQDCSAVCTTLHTCGDGVIDTAYGEQCDLGSENGQPVVVGVGARTCVVCETDCTLAVDCS